MSKIGSQPIQIEPEVTVEIGHARIDVKGAAGTVGYDLPHTITVTQEGNTLTVVRSREDRRTRALHGLYRNLIVNAIKGIKTPWQKKLEIVGTGFNAKLQGKEVLLKLGYSHPVIVKEIDGITYTVEGNNIIVVSGIDKQLVGQTAHKIKILRKPDAYKGKGIRYQGEVLRLKPGKKAKAAGAA